MEQFTAAWGMVRRRFWIIALVLILGLPLVAFYAYLKLPLFEAEAKILVESQRIPGDMARSTVTVDAAERLQVIQQRLMARDNLLKLIQDLGLFPNRTDLTLTEKVDLVRAATVIVPITVTGQRARGDTALSAFIIRVTDEDPQKAAQLANEYVTIVLDQNIRNRTDRARETTNFFTQEQEQLNREIIELEQEITRFKEENKDALPESVPFRQAEFARLGEARLDLEQNLLEIEEERRTILAQLDTLARTGSLAPGLTPEAQELRALERALVQKEAVLSPSHPEIRALRNRIEAMRAVVVEQQRLLAENGSETVASAEEETLRNRLASLEAKSKLLTERLDGIEKSRAKIAESLQKTPSIEIQLNALARQLSEKQEVHDVIARKRTEAETGERMELNQQAERFEVIENAIVPQKPIAPDRRKIVIMGSGMMIAFAFALAFLVDQMRPRVRSAAQLERQLGLRPVVSLPVIRTRQERRRRWVTRGSVAAVVLLAVPVGLYAIDRYHTPLPLLAEKLAEKSGADKILRMIEQRF